MSWFLILLVMTIIPVLSPVAALWLMYLLVRHAWSYTWHTLSFESNTCVIRNALGIVTLRFNVGEAREVYKLTRLEKPKRLFDQFTARTIPDEYTGIRVFTKNKVDIMFTAETYERTRQLMKMFEILGKKPIITGRAFEKYL